MSLKLELNSIRDRIINRVIILSLIFSVISVGPSLLRIHEVGFHPIMYYQEVALLIILALFIFRKRIKIIYKTHTLLLIFTVLPLVGIYEFRMAGGAFIFMIPLLLATLTYGFKTALYYSIVFVVLFGTIGTLHHFEVLTSDLDFSTYTNDRTTWVSILIAHVFTYVIILDIASLYYNLFRSKLKSSLYINSRYIKKNLELIKLKRRYQSLFNGSSEGIMFLNKDLRILDCNPMYLSLSGYNLAELQGSKYSVNILEKYIEDGLDDYLIIESKLNFDKHPNFVEIRTKDRKIIPLEINVYEVMEDNDLYIWLTFKDLRRIKKLENMAFSKLIEGEEKERERYSKEIHDGLGPLLSTSSFYLSAISEEENLDNVRLYSEKLKEVMDQTVRSTKEISKNLSPLMIREFGLIHALKAFIDNVRLVTDTKFVITHTQGFTIANKIEEMTIYRTLTELINNSLKYAEAKNVTIDFQGYKETVFISFTDNGKGFVHDKKVPHLTGLGILNMKNRIEKLGGDFLLFTSPGKGVEVKIVFTKKS